MNHTPIIEPADPGRRAAVALWLVDRALGAMIRDGTLHLRLPDGEMRQYGRGGARSAIAIHDWRTLRRIALNPDLALGEAWMDGTLTVEHGDLYGFLALCLANLGQGQGPQPWPRRIHQRMRMAVRRLLMHNPIGQTQRNVAHHYDVGDDLYDLFLDPKRQYSCADFETSRDSLETAQARKMRHTAAKQRLSPGQKVLDIGSGWAGLVVTDLEVLRLHYAETLRAGRKRFMARHGEAALLYDERFCRMWEFYLAACEAGFLLNGLVVFQIQLARRFDTVPMTRSYIEAGERRLPAPPTATAQFGVGCQMGGAQVRTMAAE